MISQIDMAIFIGFIALTMIIGLSSSYGIKSMREYAIGDKKFSTATIAATIVATWAGGRDFVLIISETYNNGLYFIFSQLGEVIAILLVGVIFAPRMGEFLNNLSTPEAMGSLYGTKVRIISAISGFMVSAGILAGQLKVSGLIFEYCFGYPEIYGVIMGGILVTLYSALGGLKSVTFTDVMQLLTFGTMLPTLAFCIFGKIKDLNIIINTLSTNKLFDYTEVFDFTRPKSVYFLFLFFWAIVPGFSPASFQRIAMAKNVEQSRKSFIIAALMWLFIVLTLVFISVLILSTNPNLDTKNVAKYILLEQSYTGLRGFILAGLMAMVMSTADSYINSASVIFIHDLCKPLGFKIQKELIATRIAAILLGAIAIGFALSGGSLLQLTLFASIFSMPVVSVPFMMTIFGFRSSGTSVLIAMAAGATTAAFWKINPIIDVPAAVPGMAANLIFLIGSHYILRQPGGWVGIKDPAPLIALQQERQFKWKKFKENLQNFDFTKFMSKNSPNNELMYVYTGLFCFFSLYSNMATISHTAKLAFPLFFEFVTPSVLFSATALLSYPLWLYSWKKNEVIEHVVWNLVTFYGLVYIGFIFAIISNFAPTQVMILIINLILVAVLVRWQWALVMIFAGAFVSSKVANIYFPGALASSTISLRLQIIYLLLLIGSLLIIFLKPKQEQESLLEERIDHLRNRIVDQEKEMISALSLKSEFIRNVQHEYHTPMTGIMSMSQMLYDSYDSLTDTERKDAAEVIFKSFVRLESFDSNIATLSKLNRSGYELKVEKINISELIQERLKVCQKLYKDEAESEFILNVEEGIIVKGDKYYLGQMMDNLIINAITYCKKGSITIGLEKVGIYAARLTVKDEGIGIPDNELLDIFGEFMVSSKTRTPSGGRGIGLALCKKVLEIHDGSIFAESDGKSWTKFTITLPLR
ncbi:Sensor histidine kinase YycG [Candidatus Phycorickettsia trachydisci]|uniref:histidine kinase n=1 Tax=Candidatus Phycorickettsia trachydisci TaxID=2115978 RepID=A0A2P1P7W9_9RICK|nr:ATP-binding protein [Candidatus Phycorickettsia trachydisci]AVP87370.1 Sensor histidine kinase YycG [Candidatus Phycorickettsia trachydisci]